MPRFLFKISEWTRVKSLFICCFCVCLLFISSCGISSEEKQLSSGRITIGTKSKPRTLDPADAYDLQSLSLIYNMSDRLYKYEAGSTEITPELATALPTISDDGLRYTIPIRQGVVFHDGTPFNAEAMAFSVKRFVENKGKPSFLLGDSIKSVKATGKYELTIELKQPFAAFSSLLAFSGVCAVSPKAYELGEGKFQPRNFVGTGPYKLAKFGSDSVRLEVFDKYWGDKPKNKGVNVQVLSSGVNIYNAFRKQAIDVTYTGLDPDQIRSLEQSAKKGKWKAIPNKGNVISYMGLNRNQKPLDILEVRQAIAAMIDRQRVFDRVLYGQAEAVYSLIPTSFKVYEPVFQKKYGNVNVEKTKQLLRKAGFTKDNPATIEIWYPSASSTRKLAALVLQALADKTTDGLLKFDINSVESTTFFSNMRKGLYSTFLLDWYPDFIDPDNYIQPFLSCQKGSVEAGCEDGGSKNQGSFFYDQTMNNLIVQQRKEQDPEKRKEIFDKIQTILAEQVPYIPLWQSKDYIFTHNNIAGIKLDATQNLMYKDIEKIS